LKVAIVGYAHPSKNRAPYDNEDFQIWGMNQYPYRIPRKTMWFEMHHGAITDEKYLNWLKVADIPVMMHEKHKDIPGSVKYPIETIVAEYDPYFNCTVDYMIALAVYHGYTEIQLYGIHCLHEYEYEKRGIEYWLGVCRGEGIKFSVPREANILNPVFYGKEGIKW
jgi:hypothetical protein